MPVPLPPLADVSNPASNSTTLVQAPLSSAGPNEEAHDSSYGSPDTPTSQDKQVKNIKGKRGKRGEAKTTPRRDRSVPRAKARTILEASRARIFKSFWKFCRVSYGVKAQLLPPNSSDSEVKQLWNLYTNNNLSIEDAEDEVNKFRTLSFLNAMRIGEIYQCLRESQHAKLVAESPHPERILPLDHPDRGRVQKDEALSILTRQAFDLGPEYKFQSEDDLKDRRRVLQPIRIGRALNALKNEIGWAAVIVPGLYLPNEEYNRIGIHETAKFVKYIKITYARFIPELRAISDVVEDLLFHRHPDRAFLNMLSIPKGSSEMPQDMDLTRWVSWSYLGTAHQVMPENAADQSLAQADSQVDQHLPDEQQDVTGQWPETDSHVHQDMSEKVIEQQNATDQSMTAASSHQQCPENAIEPQDETDQSSMEADFHTQTIITDTTQVEESSATYLQGGLYNFDDEMNNFLHFYDADAMDSTPGDASCPGERFPTTG